VLLSAGVGVEIVLVAFQVRHHVYCPYCLAFAAVILLLFIVNFDGTKKGLIVGSVALGFFLFALFFKGSVIPTYASRNGIHLAVISKVILRYSDPRTTQMYRGKVIRLTHTSPIN